MRHQRTHGLPSDVTYLVVDRAMTSTGKCVTSLLSTVQCGDVPHRGVEDAWRRRSCVWLHSPQLRGRFLVYQCCQAQHSHVAVGLRSTVDGSKPEALPVGAGRDQKASGSDESVIRAWTSDHEDLYIDRTTVTIEQVNTGCVLPLSCSPWRLIYSGLV